MTKIIRKIKNLMNKLMQKQKLSGDKVIKKFKKNR